MARFLSTFASQIIIFSLLSSLAINLSHARSLDRKTLGREKLGHFRVYWHDIYSGSNPSAMQVVASPGNSSTGFGFVSMIDNALTAKPELNSTLFGRAQGFYASASQQDQSLLVVQNLAFMQGKYNGSTLTVLGRNSIMDEVREMPIVGGSGLFRFARGYIQANTSSFNPTTGDAVVEYNIYVLHY